MPTTRTIHIGLALEGAGWHPAAWREPSSRPEELFTPGYWVDTVRRAEAGLLDFASIEDAFGIQSADPWTTDGRTDEVRGRLDAVLVASHVAPLTEAIGLIPVATTTHTEPFHVSKAIATLDHISAGRGGWQARVSARPADARLVGRRDLTAPTDVDEGATDAVVSDLFAEAGDAVEAARLLWDSWEDDAEIRDVATDRFLDAGKVHRIDFESEHFHVRGPAIVPRPPQGQPVVAALAHARTPYAFAARSTDLVFVTPQDVEDDARGILTELRDLEALQWEQRGDDRLRILADLVVLLDTAQESGSARLERLDDRGGPLVSDARVVAGSAESVADEIEALTDLGYDGARLRPGVTTDDVPLIVEQLIPELQRRGRFRTRYEETTLRERLGLVHPAPNRFADGTIEKERRAS